MYSKISITPELSQHKRLVTASNGSITSRIGSYFFSDYTYNYFEFTRGLVRTVLATLKPTLCKDSVPLFCSNGLFSGTIFRRVKR